VEPDYLPDSEVLAFSRVYTHEDFTPQKYVHSSTRGSAEGGTPSAGSGVAIPRLGGSGEAPEGKIAL
jgi:hypothetical protein